jgi:Abnormal spindle-like microcephaly-assoc'd, ASPM-SPD-2-Hydin
MRGGPLPTVAFLAAFVAIVGLSGCVGYTGAKTGTGKAGVLSGSVATVAFGNVGMGKTATQSLTVTNTGTAAVTVSSASITGAGYTVASGNPSGSLAVGQSVTVQIAFAPQATGSATGTFTVASDASNSPLSVALTGTGTQPGLASTPASVSFGNVVVGATGSVSVNLFNTGSASVTITQASVSGTGFTIVGSPTGQTIQPGQSFSFTAQFLPTAVGSATGSISVASNAPNSPMTIALTGAGTQAGLASTPSSVTFGNVAVGTSGSASVSLSNSGSASVTIGQVNVTGTGFTMVGSPAGQTIQPGQSISFTTKFAPTSAGNATGTISVASNAPNSPMTIPLTGAGTQPALAITPASVSFGNVVVGATGSVSVNLSNTGSASVTISQASVSGTGFTMVGSPTGQTIQPGQSFSFTAQFLPTAVGNATGSISVASNAPNSPMTIALTGTGTQAGLGVSPTAVNFKGVVVGSSGTATLNLSNTGTAAVTISQASVSGIGFAISGLATGLTLQPGQNSSFTAQFQPTSTGSASGSISVSSNSPNSPITIALTGTGTQPEIGAIPSSAPFGNVTVGNTNSQTITLTNGGTANLIISQGSVTGNGFKITGLSTPLTIQPGGNATFNANFTPTSAGKVTGSISLANDAPSSPYTIALSGTGVAETQLLTFNVSGLSFGNVSVGSNSSLPATLTNTGNGSVMISSSNATGAGFTVSGVSSGETLNPNQSIPVTVQFAPSAAGTVSGNLTIVSNATDSPTSIPLTGTGTQQAATVALGWTASTSSVIGYNVYRGTTTGGPYSSKLTSSPVTSTQFTDTSVQSGQTYYYVVTSVNSSEVESAYSGQAVATIP